jgi:hypothetical protein
MVLTVRLLPQSFFSLPFSTESSEIVTIISKKRGEAYIHYIHKDKRLDEWVPEDSLRRPSPEHLKIAESVILGPASSVKRKRDAGDGESGYLSGKEGGVIQMSEKAYDLEQHAKARATRNINYVVFADWRIKTWCVSDLFSYYIIQHYVHIFGLGCETGTFLLIHSMKTWMNLFFQMTRRTRVKFMDVQQIILRGQRARSTRCGYAIIVSSI